MVAHDWVIYVFPLNKREKGISRLCRVCSINQDLQLLRIYRCTHHYACIQLWVQEIASRLVGNRDTFPLAHCLQCIKLCSTVSTPKVFPHQCHL